ncbi:MAG: GNAT family N-acetyltransferase [Pseudomonadota bacterium]|nr:GNAT family N-acetyltransferase [Pseudomonadota bacterium]
MPTAPQNPAWPDAVTLVCLLKSRSTQHFIKNIKTDIDILNVEQQSFPITLNQSEYENSYVCSPYTAYISYARDELGLIKSSALRSVFRVLIWSASGLLKLGKINQTASINNWLFSTNLVPEWQPETVNQFTQELTNLHPNHSLSIRSLNSVSNPQLMNHLSANGWIMLPARQVYLFNTNEENWWKRNNVQNDQRLLRKTELELMLPEQHCSEDFRAIESCFHKLYIEKHSQFNPQYTSEYFELLHQNGLIEFFSFRDEKNKIVASIGVFTQQGIITAPIVGYDTAQPKSLGLYRLLIAQLLKVTHERDQVLNLSSGASDFKKHRGGKPVIEYTALYVNHLPSKQKTILRIFTKLMNQFAPKVFANNSI